MTVEATIYGAIQGLVPFGNVFRDAAPDTLVARPYVTFVQVGGDAVNFLHSPTKPSKKNGRFQINVWSDTREEAASLSRQIEDAMRTINAYIYGAPVATDEPTLNLFGTRQDFSIWYDD